MASQSGPGSQAAVVTMNTTTDVDFFWLPWTSARPMSDPAKPKLYNPRHPERTLLYQTVAEHFESWLDLASAGQFDGQGDRDSFRPFVRKAFGQRDLPPGQCYR